MLKTKFTHQYPPGCSFSYEIPKLEFEKYWDVGNYYRITAKKTGQPLHKQNLSRLFNCLLLHRHFDDNLLDRPRPIDRHSGTVGIMRGEDSELSGMHDEMIAPHQRNTRHLPFSRCHPAVSSPSFRCLPRHTGCPWTYSGSPNGIVC